MKENGKLARKMEWVNSSGLMVKSTKENLKTTNAMGMVYFTITMARS